MTYADLIAKLEAAPEGSRELDAEVHAQLTGRIAHPKAPAGYTLSDLGDERRLARLASAPYISSTRRPSPHYTTSLDDALTLVPESWGWMAEVPVPWGKAQFRILQHVENGTTAHQAGEHDADKPALALCIAALKARAALESEQ